jgi:patatin-like phospholipase/acyl hydrolase
MPCLDKHWRSALREKKSGRSCFSTCNNSAFDVALKGVFTAAVLASFEADTKLRIIDHFDLIAGTSTGGILAIGLAMGLTAEELLNFYSERGPRIFPATSLIERTAGAFRQIFRGPKIFQETLREELVAILRDRKFGEARCRLVIPSYDAMSGRIYVFKTAPSSSSALRHRRSCSRCRPGDLGGGANSSHPGKRPSRA